MKIIPSSEKLSKYEKVGIICKPSSYDLKETYLEILSTIQSANYTIYFEKESATIFDQKGYSLQELCEICDFLITIGGDGTLISVSRRSYEYDIPVLGVNLGTLGFLTDIKPEELANFLNKIKTQEYRIDSRMMIEASIGDKKFVSFNDIVFTRKDVTSMVKLDAKIDNKLFNSYYGDGLIISTPTGSTAYNLSSGGPVVFPLTEAFIVTPISPHSLTQRPLVLPVNFEIELSTPDDKGAIVIVDGQDTHCITKDQSVKIKVAQNKAKLIHRLERNYFSVLNEKLNWGH